MKQVMGVLCIIGGLLLGLYIGIWVCLIGGIIQVVTVIRAPELDAALLAYGIARVLCAGPCGGLTFFLCAIVGRVLLESD